MGVVNTMAFKITAKERQWLLAQRIRASDIGPYTGEPPHVILREESNYILEGAREMGFRLTPKGYKPIEIKSTEATVTVALKGMIKEPWNEALGDILYCAYNKRIPVAKSKRSGMYNVIETDFYKAEQIPLRLESRSRYDLKSDLTIFSITLFYQPPKTNKQIEDLKRLASHIASRFQIYLGYNRNEEVTPEGIKITLASEKPTDVIADILRGLSLALGHDKKVRMKWKSQTGDIAGSTLSFKKQNAFVVVSAVEGRNSNIIIVTVKPL